VKRQRSNCRKRRGSDSQARHNNLWVILTALDG